MADQRRVPYTYEYPRPALTVDCVVIGFERDRLKVLLVRRGAPPFKGAWALPGGFVELDEKLAAAAMRELREETGIRVRRVEQLHTFDDPKRDPRGRTVSVVHLAFVDKLREPKGADDAEHAAWHALDQLPKLAFDHAKVLALARRHLRERVAYEPWAFELLPAEFTLTQLQLGYELLSERELDRRNFRKKLLALGHVTAISAATKADTARAARLYRFDAKAYDELRARGQDFSF